MIYLIVENNSIVNRIVGGDVIDPSWMPDPVHKSLAIGDVYYPDIGIFLPPNTDFHSTVNSFADKMLEVITYYRSFVQHEYFTEELTENQQQEIIEYLQLIESKYNSYINESDKYKKYQDAFFSPLPNEPITRINLESDA